MGQAIDDVEIADSKCFRNHWLTFRQDYAKAPYLDYCSDMLEPVFTAAASDPTISAVNLRFINAVNSLLGIETIITNAREYDLDGERNERLVSLCRQAGANRYLSGPAARSYLDVDLFGRHGVSVEWMEYGPYPQYPQIHPPFDHAVSILDLLACTGENARRHLGAERT
jgi:hypothetical protein